MKLAKKLFYDCFTAKTDDIFDPYRILLFLGTLIFFGLEIYNTVMTNKFDPERFGMGFGLVLTGGGLSAKLKFGTSRGD